MEVVDGLSAVVAGVDDDAIAAIELMAAGEVGSDGHKVSEKRLVLRHGFGLRGDVFFWDDEQVCGCLRANVREADTKLVFIDTVGRNET
jgi:hypothetical protein